MNRGLFLLALPILAFFAICLAIIAWWLFEPGRG